MMDLCGRAVQKLARAWKDDSEILPWLKQLATSNDDGLRAGPPFRKARKFASLEPAFAINRCNIVNTRYTRKKRPDMFECSPSFSRFRRLVRQGDRWLLAATQIARPSTLPKSYSQPK